MLQYNLRKQNVSVIRLGSLYRQKFRAHHLFDDVHYLGCNVRLFVLLLERDGKVQDCFHEVHKSGVTAHTSDHFACNLAQPNPS